MGFPCTDRVLLTSEQMKNKERVKVLGIPVDAVTMQQALEHVDFLVRGSSRGNYVLAVNPEKVHVLQKTLFSGACSNAQRFFCLTGSVSFWL